MSKGDKFLITEPTLGIMSNGHRVPVTVPKDAIVEVLTGLVNHDRMIGVRWENGTALIFAEDLRELAALVNPVAKL